MLVYAVTTLFAFAGLAAVFAIAAAWLTALPQIRALRRDLEACEHRLLVTARIFETVTTCDDGKIVRLPVRARMMPLQALRDAA